MPLVSVIIPIYNTEKFLPLCINSVLNQTLTDIEVLLVNDGSTDGSGSNLLLNAALFCLHSLQVHISPTRAAFASFPNLNGISKVSIRFSLKNKIKSTTVFSDNAFHILIRERITQLKEQEGLSKLKRKLLPSKTSFF